MKVLARCLLLVCGVGCAETPQPTHSGFVTLQSITSTQPDTDPRGLAGAVFPTDYYCTSQPQGGCEIQVCVDNTQPFASAGTITVTGAAVPVLLAPKPDNTYGQLTMPQPLFDGGEHLTVSSTGGDIPAFSATVVPAGHVSITSPDPNAYLLVPKADGLTVTWTGSGSGDLEIILASGVETTTSLRCLFPIAAGTGTIPASALAGLPAGTQGIFLMAAIGRTEHVVGDWSIRIGTSFEATWSNGFGAYGRTLVQ
jgi:hypothetical protein